MLYSLVTALLLSVVHSTPEVITTRAYVVDKCFNLTQGRSVVYRCTDETVHTHFYQDSETCEGISQSPSSSYIKGNCDNASGACGGCDSDTGRYTVIEGCSEAQTNSDNGEGDCSYWVDTTDSGVPNYLPLNQCMFGSSSSYMDTCGELGNLTRTYYSGNCEAGNFVSNTSYAWHDYEIHCGSKDCGVRVLQYDLDDEVCNYEGSDVEPPSPKTDCNYLLLEDDETPLAVETCITEQYGNTLWSWMYTCQSATQIDEVRYLDSDSCSGDSYVVNSYTSDNYTLECSQNSNCEGSIHSYDNNYACESPDAALENAEAQKTGTPVAWNQCVKVYHEPNEDSSDWEVYDDLYTFYFCDASDGFIHQYYFWDNECTQPIAMLFDLFGVYNTECVPELKGCSGSTSLSMKDLKYKGPRVEYYSSSYKYTQNIDVCTYYNSNYDYKYICNKDGEANRVFYSQQGSQCDSANFYTSYNDTPLNSYDYNIYCSKGFTATHSIATIVSLAVFALFAM